MEEHINRFGKANLFRFLLEGATDPGVEIDTAYLEQAAGAFHTEIRNITYTGFDLEAIMAEDQNSITGALWQGCWSGWRRDRPEKEGGP